MKKQVNKKPVLSTTAAVLWLTKYFEDAECNLRPTRSWFDSWRSKKLPEPIYLPGFRERFWPVDGLKEWVVGFGLAEWNDF